MQAKLQGNASMLSMKCTHTLTEWGRVFIYMNQEKQEERMEENGRIDEDGE